MPERPLDLRQVGLVQESAVTGRFEVDAANLYIKRVFLRSDEYVRADRAQFAINLVANVGGDRNHRRGHGNAQGNRRASQEFAPLLAPEGFVDKAREHFLLSLEHMA